MHLKSEEFFSSFCMFLIRVALNMGHVQNSGLFRTLYDQLNMTFLAPQDTPTLIRAIGLQYHPVWS